MPSPAESAVAAFFHLSRELNRKKRDNGSDYIRACIMRRVALDEAVRRLEVQAEIDAYESGLG